MVKSIQFERYVLQPEEYRTVIGFFRSIGCDIYINAKGFARFSAPLGILTVREFRSGRPEQKDSGQFYLGVEVSNPDVVRNAAEAMQLKIVGENSNAKYFAVELPGSINVGVKGSPENPVSEIESGLSAAGKRFAIVVSRFNAFITERLLQAAIDGLLRCGAKRKDIEIARVPGAFEMPLAARKLAESGKYDAIICLGCLLRGDTVHYDVIVNEVTRGIGQSAQETGVPHAFGVLTCETLEQAIDRAGLKMGNKGFEAALAAVEMASLTAAIGHRASGSSRDVSRQSSAASKKQIPRLARNDKPKRAAKTKRK
jgi:6,7-dimethyl-8-ribityllumazine synthase